MPGAGGPAPAGSVCAKEVNMFDAKSSRLILVATMLAFAGMTAACESNVEREMRLEREALKESGELEELENQVNTVNPDPYDPKTRGTINRGRFSRR